MRVLGVDPGLTRCGLGVVDGLAGRRLTAVAYDVVCTPAGDDIALRLLALERHSPPGSTSTSPDVVAVERVFSQHNVRTVMGTAQAAAVAMTTAARAGMPVVLHTPERGQGRRHRVRAGRQGAGDRDGHHACSGCAAAPRPADTADALALAICHIWRGSCARPAATRPAGAQGRASGWPGRWRRDRRLCRARCWP